jgi:alkanesulfonate monooxygenase SsuD/methylene tetrahydromethanopterin reductase-like flavin-dependent oxidoreductase (luciferase family)
MMAIFTGAADALAAAVAIQQALDRQRGSDLLAQALDTARQLGLAGIEREAVPVVVATLTPGQAGPMTHPFRFGLVAATAQSGTAWTALARRAENLGFDTLLIPDTAHTLSPLPAAAAAAAATTALRVGTFVLAAGLRTPAVIARETATLATLTDARFELGLGAGRPDAADDAAALGLAPTTVAERITAIRDTVKAVRATNSSRILIAAGGPRMLALAGLLADTVALGVPPTGTEDDMAAAARRATESGRQVELSANLLAVGTETPDWLRAQLGTDAATLAAAGSAAILTGTPTEMADTLSRRRERYGVSYITVNPGYLDQLAPVIERLAGN